MADLIPPFDFQRWIDDHRDQLKPPVSNAQVFEDSDMIVMVVGSGNERNDYHVDPNPEFFYQLEGSMVLRLMLEEGEPPTDMTISAGQVFMLPANVRHSPQRKDPDGLGMVVEYARKPGEIDAFEWYCPNCNRLVHRAELQVESIVDDLPKVFANFDASTEFRTCDHCDTVHPPAQDA